MTKGKNGKLKLFALGFGVLLLLAALGLTVLTVANSYDPIANSGSPKTPLEPQSNVNPTPTPTPYSPSPTPLFTPTPTPTPYQWNNPTPPAETPTPPTPRVNAEVWQTMYVTNGDGSTYWVNPPKPIALALFGSPTGSASDYNLVSKLQNNIYMKLNTEKPVSSWMFTAKETIAITDLNGNILGTIANDATVTKSGNAVPNNQNVWVLGSSLTASQLQPLINKVTYGQCYFVIKLSNIQLALTFNDGTGQTLSASGGDAQNTLAWLISTTYH
jgi:hypothetical protein